jgi:hypothetical protein
MHVNFGQEFFVSVLCCHELKAENSWTLVARRPLKELLAPR